MFGDPPDFTGPAAAVNSMVHAGDKLWVGGKFTGVDGASRRNIAALDPASLALDGAKPKTGGGPVFALAAADGTLFAGGRFQKANGASRNRLAAFSFNGTLDQNWTPSAANTVRDMAVTTDGNGIFVTGDFKSFAGSSGGFQNRNAIAKVTTANGALLPWEPFGTVGDTARGMGVNVEGNRLYWALAQNDWAGAYDVSSGDRFFKTDTDGTVNDVVEMGDRVIIGGHFVYVAPRPFTNTCAANTSTCDFHSKVAALQLNGFLDQSWNVGLRGEGVEWQGAKQFLVDGDRLWIGGAFLAVDPDMPGPGGGGGQPQTYFARLS
jgi:hypothetical protein